MSSVILNIKEENLSKNCFCNALTYIIITPPSWLKPAVDNGQQTTDNSLRFWRLLLEELYSEYNFNKSYLTKFYKACSHALRNCIVTALRYPMFWSQSLLNCRTYVFDKIRHRLPTAHSKILTLK